VSLKALTALHICFFFTGSC